MIPGGEHSDILRDTKINDQLAITLYHHIRYIIGSDHLISHISPMPSFETSIAVDFCGVLQPVDTTWDFHLRGKGCDGSARMRSVRG